MSTEILLLLMLNHLRTRGGGGGQTYHFVQGTCYQWAGVYTPALSDNDWAKILAKHGGADRLVTNRQAQTVAFQEVATETRDGLIGVAHPATYLVGMENPNVQVTWSITGICG